MVSLSATHKITMYDAHTSTTYIYIYLRHQDSNFISAFNTISYGYNICVCHLAVVLEHVFDWNIFILNMAFLRLPGFFIVLFFICFLFIIQVKRFFFFFQKMKLELLMEIYVGRPVRCAAYILV